MKIRDIIVEAAKDYDDVHPDHQSVFSRAKAIPGIAGQYYPMYRAGVDIAGQGHKPLKAKSSPIANSMVMIAYHPIELEMINATAKNMGHDLMDISSSASQEPDTVNTVSAVRVRKAK